MNKNPDGTRITNDQLRQIAVDHGATADQLGALHSLHNSNLIRSALLAITAQARLDMQFAGKLKLDTRLANRPVKPFPTPDPDMVAFFKTIQRR